MERQQNYVREGAEVFGADGDKVGKVAAIEANYLIVEKGFFFPTDYYIPLNAIQSYNEEQVFLTTTKDEALNQGWDVQPAPDDGIRTEEGYNTGAGTMTDTAMADRDMTDRQRSRETTHMEEDVASIPVHEEHLSATRRQTDAGEVDVSKRVVTETETIEVPVTEERVRVDWRETPDQPAAEGHTFEEGSFEIPVSREEVDVQKRTVKTGEVELTRERDQHTEQVSDTVRREVVDVDEQTARKSNDKSNNKRRNRR